MAVLLLGAASPQASARPGRPEVAVQLSHGAGGMTVTPKGSFIISLHQYYRVVDRVIEVTRKGEVRPFPNEALARGGTSSPVALDAVQGLESDDAGIVWMLDNGRRSESVPKLVAWDTREDVLHKVIYLPPPVTTKSSYVADLALDPAGPYLYIADPASGSDAALIVVNRTTGEARRVLQGHYSVIPEEIPLFVEGRPFSATKADGSAVEPQAGVNPLAVDRKGRWLYFGPLKGRTLYRIETTHLKNRGLSSVELGSRVKGYSEKPICDAISIDSKGNIYAGDLTHNAIGVIDVKEQNYKHYAVDPKFLWTDGLCFGVDGRLYFAVSQLHRCAALNRGNDTTQPPFEVFSIKALSSGSVGR